MNDLIKSGVILTIMFFVAKTIFIATLYTVAFLFFMASEG